ncbi:uncharacterized protein MEPE_03969 [Melanopsichium pennsylvanicum]|uniref:Uncharacterized protein n=2 Tax=Melanopsichium pennsylvanicum TaxID=63383 RepID=A0AAJ5C5Y9_9BASI|nr:putative protein [Melanopsichium pennsylvanicum 4]SNX85260.1 uncharacterized protein MEPE_03969 [Melanopsichium pennsylvanicum]
MLRSSVGRLHKGVATSTRLASEPIHSSAIVGSNSYRNLIPTFAHPRKDRRSLPCSVTTAFASHLLRHSFHSNSYFSPSQSDFAPDTEPSDSATSTSQPKDLPSERYLPPLLDLDLVPQNNAQLALYDAIQNLNADLSWHLYNQLGKARLQIPKSAIDLVLTLQCRKTVRSTPDNIIDSHAAVRQVCDRALRLCHDRARCQIGTSSSASSAAADNSGLSTLSPSLSLRLLYLLIVEEEQIAASRSSRTFTRRKQLSSILETLSQNLDAHDDCAAHQVHISLRGRLAATLSRLGSTGAAFGQLQTLVSQASQSEDQPFLDPRPFEQLLSALAKKRSANPKCTEYLPSPIDLVSSTIDESDPILQALRLTLLSQVQVSKANIHECLQTLDSATLWWLLSFELDGKNADPLQLPDDRFALKAKWHQWQISADGLEIPQDFLDSFSERVALVLAQRGILQPALHLFDGFQSSRNTHDSKSWKAVPDHDLFTVVLEQFADRMASNNDHDARKSLDSHRGLSSDLHLAFKVYTIAHNIGVDLDSRLYEAVLKAFAWCLPTSVINLGPSRTRFTKVKAHIAQRNEKHGSRQALQVYLRRFTVMILARDPDLSKGSLSFAAQATLLGLHMRTRDYTYSKRLYQLIRLREPNRELWSTDFKAGSLQCSALHPLAAPDHATFMWLFAESTRSTPEPHFVVRLYLDWLASGNTLPSSLTALFVKNLLRAGHISVLQRVLQELQEERILLPASLARSLVASFAEAGFPDLAVEMASNVSRITVAATSFQTYMSRADTSLSDLDPWLLSSTLQLVSVALDRSSRSFSVQADSLRCKVLRLFDEFRLGLSHHLFGTSKSKEDTSVSRAQTQYNITSKHVRKAYNAVMRTQLSMVMDAIDDDGPLGGRGSGLSADAVASGCAHIEELFKELVDLGVDPDSDSWTLRLASKMYACLVVLTSPERQDRLQKTLDLFRHASEQTFRRDGPLQPAQRDSIGKVPISSKEKPAQVNVHSAVVSALIDACRRCEDLKSGLGVYEVFMKQSGFNLHVEKQRLMLLAALDKPSKWQNELDSLMYRGTTAFKHDQRFVEQLEELSHATNSRTTFNAKP